MQYLQVVQDDAIFMRLKKKLIGAPTIHLENGVVKRYVLINLLTEKC